MSQLIEAIKFVSVLVQCSVNPTLILRTSDGYTRIHSDTLRVAAEPKHPAVNIDYSYHGQRYIVNFVWDKDTGQVIYQEKQHDDVLRLFGMYNAIEIQSGETKKRKTTLTGDERMADLETVEDNEGSDNL